MSSELVDVKALVAMEYDGRAYQAGDWFKARSLDALTMGQAGRVSLTREYSTRAARPAAASEPARRARATSKAKSSTYNRRDMVAEGAND